MQSGSEEPGEEKGMNGDMGVSQDDNQSNDNIQLRDDQYGPNVHIIKPIETQGDRAMCGLTDPRQSPTQEINEQTLRKESQNSPDLSSQAEHYHTLQEHDLAPQLSIDGNHTTNTSLSPPSPQQPSPLEYHTASKDQPGVMRPEMSPELIANQMERLQAIANYGTQGLFPEHFSLPLCTNPEVERAAL